MKKSFLILFLFGLSSTGFAQVGVGVKKPGTSAMLDVHSPNGDRGVILPKVTLTAKDSFAPIEGKSNDPYNIGLIVYNKTENTAKGLVSGYYYWNGSSWSEFSSGIELSTIIDALAGKGAVFYGNIEGNTGEVLYTKKIDSNGKEVVEVINLLPSIIENLKNSDNTSISVFKKLLGYDITEQVVYTGKSVKGQYVYSFYGTTNIQSDDAEVEGVSLSKESLDLLSKGEIFKVRVLDSNYQLIDINTTDIEVLSTGVLKFSLGTPNFYLTLPQGKYGVLVELLSSIEKI